MTEINREKERLYSRLQSIESDLSEASGIISSVQSKLASVESAMATLPSRLSSVRGRGYAAMGHLEKGIDLLVKKWTDAAPLIKQAFLSSVQPLLSEINGLRAEAERLRSEIHRGDVSSGSIRFKDLSIEIRRGDLGSAAARMSSLSGEASSVKMRALTEASKVSTPLNDLLNGISAIDRDLRVAEKTVELVSRASFPLKGSESPVLALEGKIMTGEKNEGTLYLTNQRFIFEGKKEVVLERKLFIATKKKIERTVLIDQPIGILQEIYKGRVGLVAWTGVYIRFKPESRLEETPFDVKDWEAEMIMRFFNYVVGGEADRDIAAVKGLPSTTTPTIQIVRCPHCGAPYTREVYQGQTSVQCEYCGTAISVTG